ncbi:uncharacterized protein [Chelonus insularis]|uniref:uncharacterized protein n=1 Tax=Chelonus insularis TaxID=460826 RepID=UPI00158E1E95|nr:uncharacterized protein LOC118075013 [Chelonus insularis]
MVRSANNNNYNNQVVKKLSRPARNINLVLKAMRNLSNPNGSPVGKIVQYISATADKPASKRQILVALKRGVEFGLMDRRSGRYFIPKDEKRHLRLSQQQNHGVRRESSELLERDLRIRSRNPDGRKEARESRSKDPPRRRKKKSSRKSGRKSVKKTRFARSLKSYELSDCYKNPNYKASAVSSIDSLEYWH